MSLLASMRLSPGVLVFLALTFTSALFAQCPAVHLKVEVDRSKASGSYTLKTAALNDTGKQIEALEYSIVYLDSNGVGHRLPNRVIRNLKQGSTFQLVKASGSALVPSDVNRIALFNILQLAFTDGTLWVNTTKHPCQ